jgi:tripartite-type tricarboxylate transporter receptor subunit TctC
MGAGERRLGIANRVIYYVRLTCEEMPNQMQTADRLRETFAMLLLLATVLVAPAAAGGKDVADFYRGKQLKIYIRAAPGGNYDIYSRLLGRYIARYLPGLPAVLPLNMPGGGGLVALNYVANIAPQDGTVLTMITPSFPLDQALGLDGNLKVDLHRLGWIGNMSDSSLFLFTAKSSPTRTLADARRRETVMAATGNGSIMTQLVALCNNTLGTRFKVVYGYPSGPDMSLAMERGEVEGRSTSDPQALLGPGATATDLLMRYNFIIQVGMHKLPGYESVPLLGELARSKDERRIFDFVSQAVTIARPVVTTPNVAPERIAALRRAFAAALADPGFLDEARRQELQIAPLSGGKLQAVVDGMLDMPPAVLARIAKAIELPRSQATRRIRAGAAK